MRWPLGLQRRNESVADSNVAESNVAKQVDAELRRWRTSVVPLEDPLAMGDRRAKTLGTIGAAMRQAQLERQRSHQNRRWRYAVSAAALLLGLGGAVYAGVGYSASLPSAAFSPNAVETQATLSGQSGRVWVGAASASELVRQAPLGAGVTHALVAGDRVITQAGGEADLAVGADTQVQLHQTSELVLSRNDQLEKRLALHEGMIDVQVEPASSGADVAVVGTAPKRSVIVETPDAMVVVHGTVFSVGVARESGSTSTVTTVSVRRGVVAVLQNGVERQRLRAGESWSSRDERVAVAAAPAEARPASAQGTQQRHAPVSSAPVSNAPVRSVTSAGSKAKPADDGVLVSSTLEQENGLFRLAIDARNNGDDATAVRYFDQLLTTFPKSALGQEAKVERFRALKRLGRGREAAREARRYLIEHGNGFAEDEARDVALTPGP